MPFDAVPQLERQLLAILAPGPALGEVGHDRVNRVALLVLIEQHELLNTGISTVTAARFSSRGSTSRLDWRNLTS
jgi:hypothetical protein